MEAPLKIEEPKAPRVVEGWLSVSLGDETGDASFRIFQDEKVARQVNRIGVLRKIRYTEGGKIEDVTEE